MAQSLENIFVTIGITCFNAEKTIKKSIESVLQQTFKDWILIVIDDKKLLISLYVLIF